MSTASASRQVTYIRRSGSYTTTIMSATGDLWQEYTVNGSSISVSPDWDNATSKPTLEFVAISSRATTGRCSVADNAIQWYFNDNLISFASGVSTGTYAGYFKKVSTTENSVVRQQLVIQKNIVELAGRASCVIKAVAQIDDGSNSDSIQATYTIPIQQSSGKSTRVTIIAGDNKNFVIDEQGGSCILKAEIYNNGSSTTDATYKYQWAKLTGGKWNDISGATSSTLTVNESDVETYAEFMVTVSLNGASIGSDVQGVMDTSDTYIIIPNPDPANEIIYEGSGAGVTYTPKVASRNTGTELSTQPLFSFTVLSQVGVIISQGADESSYTVTEDMCKSEDAAGSDISLVITSNSF